MMIKGKRLLFFCCAVIITLIVSVVWDGHKLIYSSDNSDYAFICKPYRMTFTEDGIKQIQDNGYDIAYAGEGRINAQSYRAEKIVTVVGTNENFAYLLRKNMKEGSWFNGLHAERELRCVVLNETAALEFFGTTNALENTINLDGAEYTVVGVVSSDEDESLFYIPYGNLENLHYIENGIVQLFCKLESSSEAKLLLQISGMNEQDVEVMPIINYLRDK